MLTLVIGDKQLSSWSLRPWILLRHLGLPFEEPSLPLDTPRFRAEIGRFSPTGRVPVLLDGGLRVWDSLAICEYLSEQAQGAGWPADALFWLGVTSINGVRNVRTGPAGALPPDPAFERVTFLLRDAQA